MSYASKIIDKFGGTRSMAATLGLPPSTVQSWKVTGVIPARRHQMVLDAARERGFDLTPADFFDVDANDSSPSCSKLESGATL